MKRAVPLVVLALVVVGAATAARGDPQEQFTPADQARAKAMLLRRADVGPGYTASKPSDEEPAFDVYCRALDESDLVLTGEATGLDFEQEDDAPLRYRNLTSEAQVYKTKAQSAASWRRATSAAGMKCAEAVFRRLAKELTEELGARTTLASFRRVSVPRLAPATDSYRVVFTMLGVPITTDLIAMRNGRAQAWVVAMAMPSAYPRAGHLRLSRIVARRMAEAMRGE